MANGESGQPKPHLLAAATGKLFLGIQIACAECHDHPFAPWKQEDFWGTAAFFSRTRKGYAEGKNPLGWTITEAAPDDEVNRTNSKVWAPQDVAGPAVLVPSSAGKGAGNAMTVNHPTAGRVPAGAIVERA